MSFHCKSNITNHNWNSLFPLSARTGSIDSHNIVIKHLYNKIKSGEQDNQNKY